MESFLELLVGHVEIEVGEDLVAPALLGLVRRQVEDDLAGVRVVDPGEGAPQVLSPHPRDLSLARHRLESERRAHSRPGGQVLLLPQVGDRRGDVERIVF